MTVTAQSHSFDATHQAVAFPLGGVGTGNVSLGARGELRDWEIFNSPGKGNLLPNTFFAIRLQTAGQAPVLRVLEGPLQPPFTLSHGYHPSLNAGLPRFASSSFSGEYPFAWVELEDPDVPVRVKLEAYTPLVPLNPDDSGIPCAILTYTVRNISDQPLSMTLVGSLCNAVGGAQFDPFLNIAASRRGRTKNEYRDEGALRGIFMTAEELASDDLSYGSMSLVTTHGNVTVKPAWLRSGWWDFLQEFWDDLAEDGLLTDLGYTEASPDQRPDTGSVGALAELAPGAEQRVQFVLTWHFPNRLNSWKNPAQIDLNAADAPRIVRTQYAAQFSDAWAAAAYVIREQARLEAASRKFHQAMFESSLPRYVIDAVSANIVNARSTTCFWLEDGRFYGWEGCFDNAGCCAGSCTHVWSYAYTLAYLFPSLEREMRRIEFLVETEDSGYMYFRNLRSMGEVFLWSWGDQAPEPAADGQLGSILRAYREYQLSGDRDWLQSLWPSIKSSIGYASTHWDADQDGVLEGRQHNTYDIEFYGPNPLSGIYYLAALRAVEAMAEALGEPDIAARCRRTFENGSAKLDSLLWNGEYFVQRIDDVNAYKYQHGLGCLSDQLIGQFHAHALGFGDLLPTDHVRKAIKSVFDHNFRTNFRNHSNCQRTYVLNDESGLLLCTWPNGGRPKFPFVYSDEVWPGIEYHVAAELIYSGWVEEGLRIVQAVQDRHDGIRRNRWDEVECGHHYARSMSSWAVLLALSGQQGNLGKGTLEFKPVDGASVDPNLFQCFWSNGQAWGRYTQRRSGENAPWTPEIEVFGGSLDGVTITACGKTWQVTG